MQRGDFTSLAAHYKNRPGYSSLVLKSVQKMFPNTGLGIRVADVGAGTGKLTECLLELGLSVIAIEPNDAMREEGISALRHGNVEWMKGSGESTGLPDNSVDWLLMGSSFHWVDLEKGLAEFHRVLRPGGCFTAIWNPRDLERSDAQSRIDRRIKEMVPSLTRVSSGGKGYAADWFSKLASTSYFKEVLFFEAKHDEIMTRERYIGAWQSVNDIQSQCTPKLWGDILSMIDKEIGSSETVVVPYASRAWTTWSTKTR